MTDIALITAQGYEGSNGSDPGGLDIVLAEDRILSEALANHGWSTTRVAWSRSDVDWSQFKAAVFRSTWDYFERFDAFTAWLERVDGQTCFFNPLPQIRWNADKHYLSDLMDRSVPVVPTRFIDPGHPLSVRELLEASGWSEAVIKPAVSGSGWHTHRVSHQNADDVDRLLAEVRRTKSMLLQPFQKDILKNGEVTVVVMDGEPTHAIRKIAKPGEFRVQNDFGGTVEIHKPSKEELSLAYRAVEACAHHPLYARVDMVRLDDGSQAVMELELIEPELWFRMAPFAADRLAVGLVERLSKSCSET